ncbi:hypothetical protein [Nocardia cyriacigeorgica]|uniref:Uncharacterized protein n=1 Tax=Nocardia cyriacigeorgica TaxID=135487 RepID=A0A5R8NPV8_9NOCA|nr:hypothetical protein [Nocardia cyriacigeorgica]TLF77665.1 hypothetical protein FEK34_15270 [Nocardia cyriacigeorgica]
MVTGSGRFGETALPVSVLFVLSPLIGEILGAAFRFSYLAQPLRAAAIFCFYGAGVLLVREVVQRRGLNGWGLLLLALAFAVLEEGLGLQTIFNPQGMDGETVYGRAFEVNWLWAVVVAGYHAVWSIVIPIVLTHLVFPAERHTAWLSRSMLSVFAGVFAVGFALFVFISLVRSDFRLSAAQTIGGGAAVIILVWSAGRCRRPWATTSTKRCPKPATVGWVGFGAGLAWLMLYLVAFIGSPAPFVVWTLAALVFAAALAGIMRRWVARPGWSRRHQLNGCLGAVLALWLFGLFLVANGGRTDDIAFHFVVLAAVTVGYLWLRRRTHPAAVADPQPSHLA